MNSHVLDAVRTACSRVAEQARWVHVRPERIMPYASALPVDELPSLGIEPAPPVNGDRESTAAYVLCLDAVNFGSGYFPRLEKRAGMSGYFTIASSLKDYFEREAAFRPEQLLALQASDCARLFGQGQEDPLIAELMTLFARALRDLGGLIVERYDGRFVALLDAAERSAERLVELLLQMPLFRDVASYRGIEVPFYKRAQLAAADLDAALRGSDPPLFDDLHKLTIFADNVVPHVLRLDGILAYEPDLVRRIEAEEIIPGGSEEEIEIRACAVHAAELIVRSLGEAGHSVTARELDALLWNRGRGAAYKARPRHRTRSVYY